jgi:hypothetical protein
VMQCLLLRTLSSRISSPNKLLSSLSSSVLFCSFKWTHESVDLRSWFIKSFRVKLRMSNGSVLFELNPL